MKIRYEYVNSEVVEVEVDDALGMEIGALELAQLRRNRAETRRHASLETLLEKGLPFSDKQDLADEVERMLLHEQLAHAFAQLHSEQQQLLRWVFYENQSRSGIARTLGVTPQAIDARLTRSLIRLKKTIDQGVGIDDSRG